MEYGLIGEKLTHSFSKEIHTKYFGLDYELKELKPDEVKDFLLKKDFKAINVTIPYKETVLPYLDFISEEAEKIGAVNVIVNNNGILEGYNTDFLGLKAMIEKSGVDLKDKKVLILGDGATSKTALAVAEDLGACSIKRVSRKSVNNTISYSEAENMTDTQVIINTTPVGMYPNIDNLLIDVDKNPNLCGVFDVIYNPIRSKLVLSAMNRGIIALGGLYMLVAQAVFAVEKFKNINVPYEKIDDIFKDILNQKQNVVLIGMPGSGKSTAGKFLADDLKVDFIDTDALITEKHGDISDIFAKVGESGFREIEADVIKEIAVLQGKVIATGGGAVLRPRNVEFLKQNGKIYFLDRLLELITATTDRPLSQTKEALEQRYNERYEIYCNSCDKHIISNGTVQDTVNEIKGDFFNENLSN